VDLCVLCGEWESNLNLPIQQSTLNVIFSRRMLVAFLMGFTGGLPLLLTLGVLQAWI